MTDYKLEIKQIVDYPKCRIYRQFIQSLIADRSIRTNGCSGLFHYAVLCCYANFRTSYHRYDGISYIVHPGQWICPLREKYREILHQSYEAERCQVLRLSAASKITRTD